MAAETKILGFPRLSGGACVASASDRLPPVGEGGARKKWIF